LPGGHEDDPAAGSAIVLRGEGLGKQEGGTGIDGPVPVEHIRIECAQRPVVAAAGVVAHEDVEVSERAGYGGDQLVRRVRLGEVELVVMEDSGVGQRVGDAVDDRARASPVGSPRPVMVVRGVVVQEQAGAQRGEPPGDGVTDSGAAARAGHQGHPAA
jgi:hypothetical protein